ncbi:MAG TPA: preprotein translocase subunit YajC [Candidatus Hydrogenedentes bacterium]|nr:preprotein translocase subunit YajC [Candidatus Hydrogenedentota bacterium]HNT88695.1 preprotein translocase subunit YajC [Candidatus Hydrogenedentota bacterium]
MWWYAFTAAQFLAQNAPNAPTAPGGGAEPAPGGGESLTGPACGGGGIETLLPFILIFAVMWLLLLWPKQKQEKERQRMLGALQKGDDVVTIGGVCGTVVSLGESHVVLRIDDNVTVKFLRSAVARVVPAEGEKK